ncbi:hypothetical protein [Helicobacter sp. 11S02629-2]|uniref:hypothetical protein n=1 Tax=Helicobacter sp. 11S02629-2 TaxID=1476195 RepID=UPI000BA7D640|nr:hypothetical protein [Helicobacter sp. 11S02629-2]PAF42755.1 hypothetical protein BKH40_07625 [Helicobacter sp. 11S02629-2]
MAYDLVPTYLKTQKPTNWLDEYSIFKQSNPFIPKDKPIQKATPSPFEALSPLQTAGAITNIATSSLNSLSSLANLGLGITKFIEDRNNGREALAIAKADRLDAKNQRARNEAARDALNTTLRNSLSDPNLPINKT